MIADNGYQDAPSIVHELEITGMRPGATLSYAELTGREKRDYLFERGIRATAYENGAARPDVVTGILRFAESALQTYETKSLGDTLTRVGDELEQPRRKLFHSYGTTAKVVFTPAQDSPYTGIFGQTAYGLARFSYAGPVVAIGVVPGLALKFPIDYDRPSENLVSMHSLDGQQPLVQALGSHGYNSVFQNAFTNILPHPRPINVTMTVVKERFETVVETGKGLHQPVDNMAALSQSGERIADVLAPYRVIFRPTAAAMAASDPEMDFRDDLALNIKPAMTIYEVLALTQASETQLNRRGIVELEELCSEAQEIGTLTTESEFIASSYGDYRLFFRHNADFLRQQY